MERMGGNRVEKGGLVVYFRSGVFDAATIVQIIDNPKYKYTAISSRYHHRVECTY